VPITSPNANRFPTLFHFRLSSKFATNSYLNIPPRPEHVATLKGKGCPYWITQRRVPELIPVLGSQPAGDVSHKPGGRLPLLSARPAVTPATLKRVLPVLLLGEHRHNGCEQFA